jgi:hypothetical protein
MAKLRIVDSVMAERLAQASPSTQQHLDLLKTQPMKNTLRKYHRLIALIFCFPLFFAALTGTSIAIADQWLNQDALVAFLIAVHTFQIFKLDAILPVVNGLGLIGLVVTGLSMTKLFTKHHQSKRIGER